MKIVNSMRDFRVGDIIKYTGRSLNSVTYNKEYIIIEMNSNCAIYLDNNNRRKNIIISENLCISKNLWRNKFKYVSNI